MKKFIAAGWCVVFLLAGHVDAAQKDKVKFSSDEDKLSYVIGYDLGAYLRGLEQKLNLEALSRGVADAYQEKGSQLGAEEMQTVQQHFAKANEEKQMKAVKILAGNNRKAATDFLTANGKRKEVVSTASGLQYEILRKAAGPQPGQEEMVKVHYRGTLVDGTEFDSSYTDGEPAIFQVSEVIPGWSEALALMHVGEKWKLYIPPDLAYGDRGIDPVQPGSLLIFEVELLDAGKGLEDKVQDDAKAGGQQQN